MVVRTLTVDPDARLSVGLAARLTCLCPVNGRRDYASVEVSYVPTGRVVELESFASYLASFAAETMSHEEATEMVRREVYDAVEPDDLTVRTRWDAVEGVACTVSAS